MIKYLNQDYLTKDEVILRFSEELNKKDGGLFKNYHERCKLNNSWKDEKADRSESVNAPFIGPLKDNKHIAWAENFLSLSPKKVLSSLPYKIIKKHDTLEKGLKNWARSNGFNILCIEDNEGLGGYFAYPKHY